VAISGFDAPSQQLSLFDEVPQDSSSSKLSEVTDQLRKRFGKDAITYGRDFRL
jgi:DNA polymerase-4